MDIKLLAEQVKQKMFKVNYLHPDNESNYRLVLANNRDEAVEVFQKYMEKYTNEKLSIGIVEDIEGKLIY